MELILLFLVDSIIRHFKLSLKGNLGKTEFRILYKLTVWIHMSSKKLTNFKNL